MIPCNGNYNPANVDWLICECKRAIEYFNTLDITKEVNDKLDEMENDGSLASIINPTIISYMPPLVVESIGEMSNVNRTYILKSNSHVYQWIGENWQDTGVVYGSGIGNVLTYLGALPIDQDLNEVKGNTIYVKDSGEYPNCPTTYACFLYTYGDTAIQQFLTENYSGTTWFRYKVGSKWSEWSSSGLGYAGQLPVDTDFNNIAPMTIYAKDRGTYPNCPISRSCFVYTIGTKTSGQQLIIETATKSVWCRSKVAGSWNSWVLPGLSNAGALPVGTDLNTLEDFSVYVKDAGIYPNCPTESASYIYTIGSSTKQQFVKEVKSGNLFYRYYLNGWSEWLNESSSSGLNPYAKIIEFGNSILNGSVWISGSYNRLSAYNNSPWSIIANKMGVERSNVNNNLISDTGLISGSSQGGFLQKIKETDLKEYNCLVTHLWTSDMGSDIPLGTINSTENDGTLAGGVIALINYIKNNSADCILVLIGVPPCSYVVSGENVFTGEFGNGHSISECDTLMHDLSKKYDFIFVDWEGLQFAKTYQNFTDGNNVHANNEKTYRSMGAYISGKIPVNF